MRRKHPELERKYRVPLYPVIPILAIVSGLYVCVCYAVSSPLLAALSVAVTLIGLLVRRKNVS